MRILILGNDYSAKSFLDLFLKNEDNIVFSNALGAKNRIYFEKTEDIQDFAQANEINLVLITDEKYINLGLQELLSAQNISVLAPSIEAISICTSKAVAKKFMYKNNIKTPGFQVVEKNSTALEIIRNMSAPLVIRPDIHSFQECSLVCETICAGQKIVNNFFASGNKKIIIEDYIEGKNFSVWVISDGYSAKIIGESAKYRNDVAYFEPDFINENMRNEIKLNFINPTIEALSRQDEEYIGILGFDFISGKNNELYLLGYNSFFDDINVDFFTKGYNLNWAEVFDSVIIGDVFLKYDLKPETKFMISLRQDDGIKFIQANTKTNLERYLENLDFDLKEYKEAEKIWKS